MNGFITKTITTLSLAACVVAGPGCRRYKDLVDPCYPERYNFAARREVCAAIAPQVRNGHILDQTVWNHHFDRGSDRLNAGGMDHLIYLVHRRPCPDPVVYLATAQDIAYDPSAPEKFVETRSILDAQRVEAIQKYLNAQTAGRDIAWQVVVHDPAEVDIHAIPMNNSIQQMQANFQGILPGGLNAGGGGGGGGGS
jgi:hypothetical protein